MQNDDNINFRPQYVGYGNGEGAGLGSSALLWALLLGRRDHGDCDRDKFVNVLAAENIADLRKETTENRADIIDNLRQVQSDLKGKICDSEKEAMKAGFEAKVSILETRSELQSKVCEVGHTVREAKCEIEDKIQLSTAAILKQLHEDKLDEKNDIIEQLRHRNLFHEQNQIFANQFNSINSVLSHILMQDQKQGNKTIQYGLGNVATPTNNASNVG